MSLAYTSGKGTAFVDRALYLSNGPRTTSKQRAEDSVPEEVRFATQGEPTIRHRSCAQRAQHIIARNHGLLSVMFRRATALGCSRTGPTFSKPDGDISFHSEWKQNAGCVTSGLQAFFDDARIVQQPGKCRV